MLDSKLFFSDFGISLSWSLRQNPNMKNGRGNKQDIDSVSSLRNRKNIITMNYGGGAMLGVSIGYTRVFPVFKSNTLEAGMGAGYNFMFENVSYDVSVQYFDKRLGLGLGISGAPGDLIIKSNDDFMFIPHPILSYCLDHKTIPVAFRISFTPLFIRDWRDSKRYDFLPMIEFRIGPRF
jgi:hypothetical protein